MPRLNGEAIRPGSLLFAWDRLWKVYKNDTLNRVLTLRADSNPRIRKRVRYQPGQHITLRWVPYNTKDNHA